MKTMVMMLATLIVLSVFGGCATTPEPGDNADRQVLRDLQNRLSTDAITSRVNFGVSVTAGTVVLRGVIADESTRARALSIARKTPGVLDVRDQLRLVTSPVNNQDPLNFQRGLPDGR